MTVIIRLRNGLSVPFQAMATINNLFSIGILGTFSFIFGNKDVETALQ